MGPIWGRQDPGGPHVGPMNFPIWDMIGERRTICVWPNNDWRAELVSNELSYRDSTECIERELIALLLEAMAFAYNEDNADLCPTDVKDIAPTTVQWNLFCPTRRTNVFVISIFHMVGERTTISLWHSKYQHRLNCYHTTNTNTGWTVMTQQIPTQAELLWHNKYQHRLNCYDATNTNTGWTVMTQQIPTQAELLWHNKYQPTQAKLNWTECLERAFPALFQWVYNVKTGMNTSYFHLPWVNVKGSTHIWSPRPASSSW